MSLLSAASRGALLAGGHHFGTIERQDRSTEDELVAPPSLEEQVRHGLKRTYTMYLANYGQRPEVDGARCVTRTQHIRTANLPC